MSFAALTPLLALGIHLWVAGEADLSRTAAVRALAGIAVTQVLPGLLLWRAVRPRSGWWFEDVCMGAAFGVTLAVLAQTVGGLMASTLPARFAGPAVAIGLLLAPGPRRRILRARTRSLPGWFGPLVGGASLLLLREAMQFFRQVPLEHPGFMSPYVDMPFHLALSSQLAARGPTGFPHVVGEPLSYHWFSHAWVAQVGVAGGIELDAVMYRLLPALTTVALVSSVAIAATRLSGRVAAGPLAALLTAGAGVLAVLRPTTQTSVVRHLSPSLAVSTLLLVSLVVVLALRWRGQLGPSAPILVVGLAVAASGTKGSALPVLVGGLALATTVGLARRSSTRWRLATDLALVLASLLGSLLVLFSGGAQEISLSPAAALERMAPAGPLVSGVPTASPSVVAVGIALVILGVAVAGAGFLAAITEPDVRADPVAHLLLGIGLAGAAAVTLLSHPGGSQGYFLRTSLPFLAILSAWGLWVLWERHPDARRPSLAGAAVGATAWFVMQYTGIAGASPGVGGRGGRVATGLLALGVALGFAGVVGNAGRERPRAAPVGAIALTLVVGVAGPSLVGVMTYPLADAAEVIPPDRPRVFSGDQIEAARWLRDHSRPDDLVATNRHCGNPRAETCDNRRFFVAAYTERQVLLEGWGYTPTVVELAIEQGEDDAYVPYWRPEILELNDGFLTSPSPEEARELWDLGVRWLFVDEVVEHAEDFGDLATERYSTKYATVYELQPPTTEDTP